jgi:CheY-like chemotaxis protein
VDDPEKKAVLLYERRDVYGQSIAWSLKNLGTPMERTTKDELLPQLEKEKPPFVFISPDIAEVTYNFVKENKLATTVVLLANLEDTAIFQRWPMVNIPAYTVPIANILNGIRDGVKKEWTEIGFTAPEARILVVDDIASNLEVARGFLNLYRMNIDTASDGEEAIQLAQENTYDVIFMDHMMPGMDGIEAAAAIRNLGVDTPIIALTANAVSGMRELFIENDFNDYLSKPIEINQLDTVIAKWIPPGKQVKVESPLRRVPAESTELTIPGIDTARGITMTGGTEEGYRKVLAQFYKDAVERLPVFAAPPEDTALAAFATQVHAIKSAVATIGAANLSKEAEVLEAAGKAEDAETIGKILPGFHGRLLEIIEGIAKALGETEGEQEAGDKEQEALMTLFPALQTALAAKSMKEIDKLLEEIAALPLGAKTREGINLVSDNVLMGEYEAALETLKGLVQ